MKRLAIIAALLATPVHALDCFPRDEVAAALARVDMQMIFAGLNQLGVITEIWIAQDGRWIEVISAADGISCIYDGGLSSGLFTAGAPA